MSYLTLYRLNHEDIKLLEAVVQDIDPPKESSIIVSNYGDYLREQAEKWEAQQKRIDGYKELIQRIGLAGVISE